MRRLKAKKNWKAIFGLAEKDLIKECPSRQSRDNSDEGNDRLVKVGPQRKSRWFDMIHHRQLEIRDQLDGGLHY